MAFADVGDELTLRPARRAAGRVSPARSPPACPKGDGNIVHRAALRLADGRRRGRPGRDQRSTSGCRWRRASAAARPTRRRPCAACPAVAPAAGRPGPGRDRPGAGQRRARLPGQPARAHAGHRRADSSRCPACPARSGPGQPPPAAGDRRRVRRASARSCSASAPRPGAGSARRSTGCARSRNDLETPARAPAARDRPAAGGPRGRARAAASPACPAAARPASACSRTPPPPSAAAAALAAAHPGLVGGRQPHGRAECGVGVAPRRRPRLPSRSLGASPSGKAADFGLRHSEVRILPPQPHSRAIGSGCRWPPLAGPGETRSCAKANLLVRSTAANSVSLPCATSARWWS